MNDRKIAFIICVNDENEFNEALHYIELLHVPDGYETDVIAVREAPSMTAGYNAAMESSDAKYKIYIHQDVFLVYPDMLGELIAIFQADSSVGMVGTFGARKLPENAHVIGSWDVGKVLCNDMPAYYLGYQDEESHKPVEVMAIDGMFMATQYDIPWREDIFDGWDFYDLSQTAEFIRQGKRVVVPYQKTYWTLHDNKALNLRMFDEYRDRFIEEYQDIYPFKREENTFEGRREYEEVKAQTLKLMQQLIDAGQITEVCALLENPENQRHPVLRELELICKIHSLELANVEEKTLYQAGMSYKEVYHRFRTLRHFIKRFEISGCLGQEEWEIFKAEFSSVAVATVIENYAVHPTTLYEKMMQM